MTNLLAKLKKTSKGPAMISGFLVLPSCYYVNPPVFPHQPYQLPYIAFFPIAVKWHLLCELVSQCYFENVNSVHGTTFPQIKKFYCKKYYNRQICWILRLSGSPLLFTAHILQSKSI